MRVHVSFCTSKKTPAPTASLFVCSLAGLYMLAINSSNLKKSGTKISKGWSSPSENLQIKSCKSNAAS